MIATLRFLAGSEELELVTELHTVTFPQVDDEITLQRRQLGLVHYPEDFRLGTELNLLEARGRR
jgi:hypothetical protein